MSTTHAFMTGRSQAVRIPKEYRLPDEEIFVNRIGHTITLTPVSKLKESFAESLRMFTDDFMEDGRPPQIDAKRDEL
ncbi:MAG: type II toxin-antitoxin system VapB family antitoxin [Clostridia bacterium]|jgi:antitoxin VapB|nr:AbrB/MazE/SpoVT family DNA-binding domain-containing protein [Clostridia bacterium]